MNYNIKKLNIYGKEVYLFREHHWALIPWSDLKYKEKKKNILLFSLDHHTDTHEAFMTYCFNKNINKDDLLIKIDVNDKNSILEAISKLKNDEHINTAIDTGIIDFAYIISYMGCEKPISNEEKERLNTQDVIKMLLKKIRITPWSERTYPETKVHTVQFAPEGIDEFGEEYDTDVLEDSFLREKMMVFSRMSNGIILENGCIKCKYILDIDLDYFHKYEALDPKEKLIFSNLVNNAEIITIAQEPDCVEQVRTDNKVTSEKLEKRLINLIESILQPKTL